MLKRTILAGAAAAALGSGLAPAQQPAAPTSPHTLTGNVGFYSQYIFRGLTQTDRDPALQGGFDYAHSSGFYAGTWGSNISWLRDGGGYSSGGSLEWDFYGGYKLSLPMDISADVGLLYYWYPGDANPACRVLSSAVACPKANTFEVYGALGWKWLTAKYSYSLDNKTFGVPDSRGTWYLDFGVAVPIGSTGLTFDAHYGIQKFRGHVPGATFGGAPISNDSAFSYEDWRVGVSYTLPKDFTIGAFYTDTSSAHPAGYGSVGEGGSYPRNIARGTGTIYIKKTF